VGGVGKKGTSLGCGYLISHSVAGLLHLFFVKGCRPSIPFHSGGIKIHLIIARVKIINLSALYKMRIYLLKKNVLK